MNTRKKLIGAALFALLLMPALAFTHPLTALGILTLGVAGVTITYAQNLDVSGTTTGFFTSGTVAPTLAQAALLNSVSATVILADADTTATLVHNLNLPAAAVTALGPWVNWYWTTAGTGLLAFTLGATNLVIGKGAGTGSGGTFNIVVSRPNSFIR
jgi:hypothetical protein